MAIADDISVAANGDIRSASGSTNYTVLELHRFLQDLADDATASGDDLVDITDENPSNRQTNNIIELLNGYNIDDTLAQRLYDGSIIQGDGDEIYDGIQIFAPAGTYVQIIQNGALATNFWTTGINADATSGISHRFILKVRTGGADIDGRRFIATTREFGSDYAEFIVAAGTERGKNTVALTGIDSDLNNQTNIATIAAIADITNTEGYAQIDVTGDGTDEDYYSNWDRGANTINTFYERMKWLTRRGTTETLYGLDGDIFRGITHQLPIDTPSGTFQEPEAVSWSGGTGQLLAIDSTTAGTKMWIQLLTGAVPADNATITGGTSSATCLMNGSATERTVSAPFCGQSTGSAIIGAYGFGIEAADLAVNDRLIDLDGTTNAPPNNVQFTVNNLVSGDRVLVTNDDTGIDKDQLSLNATTNGAAVTTIVVVESIPSDTPSSGTIRVVNDEGLDIRLPYSSWTGSTFTLTSAYDFSGSGVNDSAAAGNDVYITYLDAAATGASESFTAVYNADRTLFVRVRDGGGTPIKPFETTATLGSNGGEVTVIRTSDA